MLREFDKKKHDSDVEVRTTVGCAWTAQSNSSWIEITQGDSRTGTRKVRYRVSENKSLVPRVGTLTIAGLTHTVMQEGD